MRLCSIFIDGRAEAALSLGNGFLPIKTVNKTFNKNWPVDLFELIINQKLEEIKAWLKGIGGIETLEQKGGIIPKDKINYGPLYRHPRKIWGIGLNYAEHAADLKEVAPNTEPASFMKPDTTIIGPNDRIFIPKQSHRTTAEAELGIIIGQKCKDVSESEAPSVIAGFTTILDMTAEDILEKNPRYLTRAKSFDTFFSFGPELVTPDEIDNLSELTVATVINGKVHRKNTVANMMFSPWHLVSFHSKVMTLLPGDIISTGTPGACVIQDGDTVACVIDGFEPLINRVTDLKKRDRLP